MIGAPLNRRQFLRNTSAVATTAALMRQPLAWSQAPAPPADHTIRIAPTRLELAPGKIVKTTAFNGRVPGELIRVQEGKPVTIDVINDTDASDIVHWHGLHIPSREDGATEEGSPASAPHGGLQRFNFIAKPSGFRWYHSHSFAGHNLNRSLYTGEFGFFMIDPASDPARYDQEHFLALHDWKAYISPGESFQEVAYNYASINDKMLGFGEPIRVNQGEHVLLHVLNASATLMHTLALPGHQFLVTALDGNPVPKPTLVHTIRLGPAERVDAIVVMDQPGVWVLGEIDDEMRKNGLGLVVEYANQTGAAVWKEPADDDFHYETFSAPIPSSDSAHKDEVQIPLVFKPKFEGQGDFDHWTINGLSWPKTKQIQLTEGTRYRLILENQSDDIHPIHLHRHTFELKSINNNRVEGVMKDVLLLPKQAKTEVAFTANNPGLTLFHCHQQDHMDSGFMMLFNYA
jgi:FtsP/CotA-like multicopper oxidase with cupredoxin domain